MEQQGPLERLANLMRDATSADDAEQRSASSTQHGRRWFGENPRCRTRKPADWPQSWRRSWTSTRTLGVADSGTDSERRDRLGRGRGDVLLSEALVELARSNDGYARGSRLDTPEPSPAALQIVVEREWFAPDTEGPHVGFGAPTAAVVQRFIHENRGLILLIVGRLDDARANYARAVDAAANNSCGRIKSLLGVALVDHVRALREGGPVSRSPPGPSRQRPSPWVLTTSSGPVSTTSSRWSATA